MKRDRRAKIIATLGPATSERDAIEDLFTAGADVFRLNFSHGSRSDHENRLEIVRALERKYERPIAVMADLQGPKLRISAMKGGGADLADHGKVRLELGSDSGDAERIFLPHPEIFQALEPGTDVLLDDGKIRLRISASGADRAEADIVTGGRLTDRKGVNIPNAVLPLAAITDKDRADLEFALEAGVDWVALSFVQRPDDLAEARELVGDRAALLSKLEKPAAIERLDEIIALSDALMVARGDLGVELPPEDVPGIQKLIVRHSRRAGKPVVVATQMLESMIHAPDADPRRGVRHRDRGLRRRRRGHAVGGDRHRRPRPRGGGDHGPHRRPRRTRRALPHDWWIPCATTRSAPPRTRSPPPRAR